MENKKKYIKQLFLHLDGIIIIPTLAALHESGILTFIKKNKNGFKISDISKKILINEGYVNIALRTLLSTGFLKIDDKEKYNNNKTFHKTSNFFEIEKMIDEILLFSSLLKEYRNFNIKNLYSIFNSKNLSTFSLFQKLIRCKNLLNENKVHYNQNFYFYLEGVILSPILCFLGFCNLLGNNKQSQIIKNINNILINHKIDILDKHYNEKTLFFISRLSSYGVTTSYLPTLNKLTTLLTINKLFVWERNEDGYEKHVNREINVWGSGGAHKFYFKKIDELIIKIFNQNIKLQPKGVLDMGCGDGTFLKHCYDLIINKTIRKKYLDSHPLLLIGADINKAAREASREKLNHYNIKNIIIKGDISNPEDLNNTLNENFNENLNDFLNTRTFLDHNRIFSLPKNTTPTNINTTGAYCFKGKLINNNLLTNNLIEHFKKWKNFTFKYGIIILELHTIDPILISKYRGSTLACSYDSTHGYSDQYLIEYVAFLECAKKAKLNLVQDSILFPNQTIPTISISYFK